MEQTKQSLEQQPEKQSFVEKLTSNKKLLWGLTGGVAAIIIAIIAVVVIRHNGAKNAEEAQAKAETTAITEGTLATQVTVGEINLDPAALNAGDTLALKQYLEAAKAGYKAGERAKVMAAITYYSQGKYQDAIKMLDDADTDSDIINAGIQSLKGDCYVNLDKFDEALKCYDEAIDEAEDNEQIVPFVLVKKANVYRQQKKFNDEYEAYKKVVEKYPNYAAGQNGESAVLIFYERAKAAAGK